MTEPSVPRITSKAAKMQAGTYKPHRDPSMATRGDPLIPVPPPPDHLTSAEQAVWIRLSPRLEGIVTAADLEGLGLLCVGVARAERCSRDKKATHAVVLRVLSAALGQLAMFGMVPNARERVPVLTAKATESPFDEM